MKKRDCSSARIYSSYLLHLGDFFFGETGTSHFANIEFTVGVNSKLTMGTAINIKPYYIKNIQHKFKLCIKTQMYLLWRGL